MNNFRFPPFIVWLSEMTSPVPYDVPTNRVLWTELPGSTDCPFRRPMMVGNKPDDLGVWCYRCCGVVWIRLIVFPVVD